MLDGDVRGREEFGEVFGHIGMFGGVFEVAKHLVRELAGSINSAAFGANAEAFGSALVEVGSVVFLAVRIDSHR